MEYHLDPGGPKKNFTIKTKNIRAKKCKINKKRNNKSIITYANNEI